MKYYVVDDFTGACNKLVDFKTYVYYVQEFGIKRMDKRGVLYNKLPARLTDAAYNEHGYLIAERV